MNLSIVFRSNDRYGGGGYGGGGYGGGYGGDRMGGLGSGLRTANFDLSKLPPFEKNFYVEHPHVSARSGQYTLPKRLCPLILI